MWEAFVAKLTWQVVAKAIGVVALLGLITFAGLKIKGYLDHVAAIEQANKDLTADKDKLTQQKADLVKQNADNQRISQTEINQLKINQNIATDERTATVARATAYKDISNAIAHSSTPVQPVSPVVSDTLDRLWGPAPQVAR